MTKKFENKESNLTPLLIKEREKLLTSCASHTNSGEVRKCAFSLLEKPLRSNPLFAKLSQSLTRFSHTKFRNSVAHSSGFSLLEKPLRSNDNRHTEALAEVSVLDSSSVSQMTKTELRMTRKCAFSLAEAMVMLVIVTILMGLLAPLVAKKASADLKNFKYPILANNQGQPLVNSKNNTVGSNFVSIFGALGNNQNFGIGTNEPNAKLHIQGGGNDADLLNVSTGPLHTANAANDTGLFVRQRTEGGNRIAEVNILDSCIPDWNRATNIPNPLTDGYLLVSNCATITDSNSNSYNVCPTIIPAEIKCAYSAGPPETCSNPHVSSYTYAESILVPVNAGLSYSLISRQDQIAPGIPSVDSPSDTNRFIPCVNNDGKYKAYKRG